MLNVEFKREQTSVLIPAIFNRPNYLVLFDKIPEKKLRKGEIIFSGSSSQHYVYLVTKGIVKLYSFHDGKEMLEDYYLPSEMLNCGAAIDRNRGDVIAEAMTQMSAIKKIPVSHFKQALQNNTALLKDVLNSISTSLERSQERLRRVTLLPSRKRIIDFLINHTQTAGRRVGFEFVVKPAITHKELGTIAGTSRQTATTVLNELRSKRVIHFNRSYLIVRDLEALKQMALEGGD